MERSVRFERSPWIFEVYTVKEEGGEEALGTGEGGGRQRELLKELGIAEELGERARLGEKARW